MDSKTETVSDKPDRLGVIFFNENMFRATGESDKPFMVIELTHEQQQQLAKMYKQGYSILSIHLWQK